MPESLDASPIHFASCSWTIVPLASMVSNAERHGSGNPSARPSGRCHPPLPTVDQKTETFLAGARHHSSAGGPDPVFTNADGDTGAVYGFARGRHRPHPLSALRHKVLHICRAPMPLLAADTVMWSAASAQYAYPSPR